MPFSVVYYNAKGRETVSPQVSYSRAMDRASVLAIKLPRPFPIIILDDEGRLIHEIKG